MPDSSVWLCSAAHITSMAWYLEEGKRGSQSVPLFYTPHLGVHNSVLQEWAPEGRTSAQGCISSGYRNPFPIQFLAHGQKEKKKILEWLSGSKLLSYWNVAEQYGRLFEINLTSEGNTSAEQSISNYYSIMRIKNLSESIFLKGKLFKTTGQNVCKDLSCWVFSSVRQLFMAADDYKQSVTEEIRPQQNINDS